MVARQSLTLFVKVRVLVPQPNPQDKSLSWGFFISKIIGACQLEKTRILRNTTAAPMLPFKSYNTAVGQYLLKAGKSSILLDYYTDC